MGTGTLFASRGPLGAHIGCLLGPLGGILGRLEAIFGVFDLSWTVWDHIELSWRPFGALLERSWGRLRCPLGPSWTP
eukprot:7080798-Pyramimonas_sp.AAC.1